MEPNERVVTLVLVTPDGRVLGALPPFPVRPAWWPEAGPVVREARRRYGVDATILRILDANSGHPAGGEVTYVAEVNDDVPRVLALTPWPRDLPDHPLRLPYARPGGPAADIAWATDRLADRGLRLAGAPEQIKTWNLSSLWRLPLEGSTAWLKAVPHFLGHEGALLTLLVDAPVPRLLGHDRDRSVLADAPGLDLWEAPLATMLRMVSLLVDLQRAWADRVDDLLALGMPDWRAPSLEARIAEVVARVLPELPVDDRSVLLRFVAGLPQRFARLLACGIPETLVHGDFHRGNFRGDLAGGRLVLLDWGDSGVGHPLLDQSAFLSRIPVDAVGPVREHWHAEWRRVAPGADPDRAATLLGPIASARQAVIYRHFLDNIEPSEHPYHAADPAEWLTRTAEILRAEQAG